MPVAGSLLSSLVEKLPSVQTTRGAINSSERNRYAWQLSISCGSGSRLPGGRQRRTLVTNTSPRVRPISPSRVSSSRPAWPTNGTPCLSSLAPGASPTSIRSASALPEPNTTVVREAASCGQRLHAHACRQTSLSWRRRSSTESTTCIVNRAPAHSDSGEVRTPHIAGSPYHRGHGRHRLGRTARDLFVEPQDPSLEQPASRAGTGLEPPRHPWQWPPGQ